MHVFKINLEKMAAVAAEDTQNSDSCVGKPWDRACLCVRLVWQNREATVLFPIRSVSQEAIWKKKSRSRRVCTLDCTIRPSEWRRCYPSGFKSISRYFYLNFDRCLTKNLYGFDSLYVAGQWLTPAIHFFNGLYGFSGPVRWLKWRTCFLGFVMSSETAISFKTASNGCRVTNTCQVTPFVINSFLLR